MVCGCDSAVGRLDGCQVASDLQQEASANPETKFQRPLVPGCRGPDYSVYVGIMRCGWTWSHVMRLYVLLRTAPWAGCVLSGDCSSVPLETHRLAVNVTVRYSKACARGRPGWLRWVLGMNGLNVPGWGTAARPDWLNHYWSLKRLSLWSPTAGQQPGGAGPS